MSRPRQKYLICYDISQSARRLARVRRRLIESATPIQFSVFWAVLTQAERDGLIRRLAGIIKAENDDIRLYPLPENPVIRMLGRPVLPEGVIAPLLRPDEPKDAD